MTPPIVPGENNYIQPIRTMHESISLDLDNDTLIDVDADNPFSKFNSGKVAIYYFHDLLCNNGICA